MKHLFDACWSETKYTSTQSLKRQSRFRMIGEAKTLRAPGAMLIGECLCQPNILLFTANSRKIIPKYEFLVKHFKTSRISHHRQQHCYRGNQGRSGENQQPPSCSNTAPGCTGRWPPSVGRPPRSPSVMWPTRAPLAWVPC